MTPREISGSLHFAEIDAKRERAETLVTGAMASRGDPKDIKRQLKEAEKE